MSDKWWLNWQRFWLLFFVVVWGVGFGLPFLVSGCDSPQEPTLRTPTIVYFFEFEWELTTETQHHCPQPWDTHLWMPGEVVILHGRQTRYPFLAAAGGIPDSSSVYNTYDVRWMGNRDWETLRVLKVPNAGIIWVQANNGIAGDMLMLVKHE